MGGLQSGIPPSEVPPRWVGTERAVGFLLQLVQRALDCESVDPQSVPSSVRVLCDLRPGTPSGPWCPHLSAGRPLQATSPASLPHPEGFEEAGISKPYFSAAFWDP